MPAQIENGQRCKQDDAVERIVVDKLFAGFVQTHNFQNLVDILFGAAL